MKTIKLADAAFIRSVDRAAVKGYGISGIQLMENAGAGVAGTVKEELLRRGLDPRGGRVAVFCGKGNNGGDGFAAARHLANAGLAVEVFLLGAASDLRGDARANCESWKKMGGAVRVIRTVSALDRHDSFLRHSAVLVDAIFGTGLASPPKGVHASVIERINSLGKPVVSVDVPSGIDATTGAVLGVAVAASATATMAMPKIGLYVYPGKGHAGRVEVIDIGAPAALTSGDEIRWNLVTGEGVRATLRPRLPDTHKGTYGHLLVVGGSPGKSGAAYLTAMGAMRGGAGLVTLAVPEGLSEAMEAKTTEVMTQGLPASGAGTLDPDSFDAITGMLPRKAAIVVGPGLGFNPGTEAFMTSLLKKTGLPLVIDADGLNSITGLELVKRVRAEVVLTPHPGEAARLLDTTTVAIQNDRVGSATRLAALTGSTVVLKGAATVTASPSGEVYINATGNPGLATAGTGDVLAGMIGALLAQGYGAADASVAAVYVHGLAGDEIKRAQGEAGMTATDLLAVVPRVLNWFTPSIDREGWSGPWQ